MSLTWFSYSRRSVRLVISLKTLISRIWLRQMCSVFKEVSEDKGLMSLIRFPPRFKDVSCVSPVSGETSVIRWLS